MTAELEVDSQMVSTALPLTVGGFEFTGWTLTNALRTHLDLRPDHVALQDPTVDLTYAEVWVRAASLAGGFRDLGVTRGDRVITMLDNHVDNVLALVALNFLGAVAVPTNTMYRGGILTHVFADSGATVAVVEAGYLETALRFDGDVVSTFVVRGKHDVASERPIVAFAALDSNRPVTPFDTKVWDPLFVGYTSGTTGPSKGVVITNGHMFLAADPDSVQGLLGTDDEVIYVVSPMFHMLGLGGMMSAFIVGGSVYIESKFSASTFIADATRIGATHTALVATMGEFLMAQPERDSDAQCSLRTAYMNPVHSRHREFTARFGIALRSSFGSTEVGGVISTAGDQEAIDRISCGRARPGFEIRLVDEHDIEVPLGATGECIVRYVYPWTLCLEYLGRPEATAEAWRNGWFHTGDLLQTDEAGYFYFVDRRKDAIRRRGENVSSMEVEREVRGHDDVIDCAAVAVEGPEFEQEIKIFVIRREDSALTEEVLTKFLIDRLPRYAVPRFVQFTDDFPRTPTAKARKDVLRQQSNDGCWDREAAGIVIPR